MTANDPELGAVETETPDPFDPAALRISQDFVASAGVKQVLEVHRQMRGQCGDYQLAKTPTRGLTANMGGDDRTTVVMLHQKI